MPSDTGEPVLSVERSGHVASVFLDRPAKRNAMARSFFVQLRELMENLGAKREVRAIVLAAKGPHFSVGLDLSSLSEIGGEPGEESSPAETARRTRQEIVFLQEAVGSLADCPKPVVAAVHGYCIGGGVDLIAAADIRVSSRDAVFSVRETAMAIVADLGSLARLPFVLSSGHLAELALTGKDIDAERALQIGLVNHLYADAKAALSGAQEIAAEIAGNSPLAVEGTKAVLQDARRAAVEASLSHVALLNSGQLRSKDLKEAVSAFFEKRSPSFEGR